MSEGQKGGCFKYRLFQKTHHNTEKVLRQKSIQNWQQKKPIKQGVQEANFSASKQLFLAILLSIIP
jgi:hypothetical protein